MYFQRMKVTRYKGNNNCLSCKDFRFKSEYRTEIRRECIPKKCSELPATFRTAQKAM